MPEPTARISLADVRSVVLDDDQITRHPWYLGTDLKAEIPPEPQPVTPSVAPPVSEEPENTKAASFVTPVILRVCADAVVQAGVRSAVAGDSAVDFPSVLAADAVSPVQRDHHIIITVGDLPARDGGVSRLQVVRDDEEERGQGASGVDA